VITHIGNKLIKPITQEVTDFKLIKVVHKNIEHVGVSFKYDGVDMVGNYTTSEFIKGLAVPFACVSRQLSTVEHISQKKLDTFYKKAEMGKAHSRFFVERDNNTFIKSYEEMTKQEFLVKKFQYGVNDMSAFIKNSYKTIALWAIHDTINNLRVLSEETSFEIKDLLRDYMVNSGEAISANFRYNGVIGHEDIMFWVEQLKVEANVSDNLVNSYLKEHTL